MPNVTTVTILKTHRSRGSDVAWDVEFTDRRKAAPVRLTITREELRNPARPTLLSIETACIRRHNPPVKLRASRATRAKPVKWTAAHEAARDVAGVYGADIDRMVGAIDSAHAEQLAEHDGQADRLAARRAAARHLEIAPHRLAHFVARVENGYQDRASVARFDELTEELADAFPGAGIDRDDPDTLWELLRATPARRPTRFGAATLQRAAELVATVVTDEIEFAEWREDADSDDSAPF